VEPCYDTAIEYFILFSLFGSERCFDYMISVVYLSFPIKHERFAITMCLKGMDKMITNLTTGKTIHEVGSLDFEELVEEILVAYLSVISI
jgi:hypothetical protein